MENLGAILEFVDDELGSIRKNGRFRSKDEIELVYKLVDIAKDAYCIMKEENEMGDTNYNRRSTYSESRTYHPSGMSYSRGRNRYNGYSYNDGMDQYIDMLHRQFDTARDDRQREVIERMIDDAERSR